MIGAMLQYNSIPVCDLRVAKSSPLLASTKQLIWTDLPNGLGALGGTSSIAPV